MFVLTCKYDVAVLTFDKDGLVTTVASGSVADRICRPAENGIIVTIHRSGVCGCP